LSIGTARLGVITCYGYTSIFDHWPNHVWPVVPWSRGPVVPWSCGLVVLWSRGLVVSWSCGPVVRGPVVSWSRGLVVPWSCNVACCVLRFALGVLASPFRPTPITAANRGQLRATAGRNLQPSTLRTFRIRFFCLNRLSVGVHRVPSLTSSKIP
jgi:hypothetical protein